VALGDGAGLIDAGEEEGHALGARALQGREPVGHLLDRGAELDRELFEVVAGVAGGLGEAGVGHQDGAREIVGHADARDLARGVGLEAGEVERGLQQLVLTQKRVLVEQLKALRLGRGAGRERERARLAVVVAHAEARGGFQRDAHAGDGFGMGHEIALGLAGEPFGGAVHGVDVVVAIVEEIAHLLPGGGWVALPSWPSASSREARRSWVWR
jgi:hypothetical protein